MKSIVTINSNFTLTSDNDLQELQAAYPGEYIPGICGGRIEIFDTEKQASRFYFWSIEDAIEDAKERFIEEHGEDIQPMQVNFDRFIVVKDGEDFQFELCEFMQSAGEFSWGTTYASYDDAIAIFDGSVESTDIDLTYLMDFKLSQEEI